MKPLLYRPKQKKDVAHIYLHQDQEPPLTFGAIMEFYTETAEDVKDNKIKDKRTAEWDN